METQSSEHAEHGPNVVIRINDKERIIHRGHETVAEIKKVGEVPIADDLEQIINGNLEPLPDNGSLTIHGGEQFISHPKGAGSS
jgi:hypothetical protein